MQIDTTHRESTSPSVEAVRLLWEGTRKAIDEGIDTEALVALCDIIVRLADHRLLHASRGRSPESDQTVEQLRHYRELAAQLLRWASAPTPEPDWAAVAERLKSIEANPLELTEQSR
jgi:hypothetical protein